MQSVLADYFEATSEATSPVIQAARGQFASIESLVGERRDDGPKPVSVLSPNIEISALRQLAERRRSVRWFEDRQVLRQRVDDAIAVAMESPTACNRQPYRFEVFDDPDSVRRVAAVPGGTRGFGEQIPGLIVVIGDMSAFFDARDRHLIYIDGSLASMGVVYGLEVQGIASCCINWPDVPERDAQMRELLGLADYERVVMLIAYGYADPEGLAPTSTKREIDAVRTYRVLG
ncbi:nitroreductase family protein [Microbacterium dauci]|uniref:Nitroreductase family protein n=1 Tax=Microbacterium dauci TaxID=3048008 RepID=A0ABT6ZE75_9MICO|nr:nitroreductase family protein [Microbacterium sp. LX3-4]MDJ1114460.1 nitroreductase family protein [Microbacterium sp. LX3-4]